MIMTIVIIMILSIAALASLMVLVNSQTGFFSKWLKGKQGESNVDSVVVTCNSLVVREAAYSYCCEEREVILKDGESSEKTCDVSRGEDWSGERINELDCDWAYSVDVDEFFFPETKEDPRIFLKKQKKFNVIFVKFYKVYKHITEKDLDSSMPILSQRQHGNPIIRPQVSFNPRIVRPEIRIEWTTACHNFAPNDKIKIARKYFLCSHWRMADVDLAIERLIYTRHDRMCKRIRVRKKRMERMLTKNEIIEECENHSRDPRLF